MTPASIILLDFIIWPVIHIGVSKIGFLRKESAFNSSDWLYRSRPWERDGKIYCDLFAIKKWKRYLPDGGKLFQDAFRKGRLISRERSYLQRYRTETCRGEWVHWITLLCTPVFFIWNPLWADAVMLGYALLANGPCIIVQRYNRMILQRIDQRHRDVR